MYRRFLIDGSEDSVFLSWYKIGYPTMYPVATRRTIYTRAATTLTPEEEGSVNSNFAKKKKQQKEADEHGSSGCCWGVTHPVKAKSLQLLRTSYLKGH